MAIVGFVPLAGLWGVAWPTYPQRLGSFHAVARPPDSTAASRTASVIKAVRPMRRSAGAQATCLSDEGATASGSAGAAASLSADEAGDASAEDRTGVETTETSESNR